MSGLLFVYGTLRDPDLLDGVLGRSRKTTVALPAAAPGFAVVHYPGRVYPAMVRRPGAVAVGLVLTDLTPFEFDLLDAFEGAEYLRDIVPVIIGEELHEAFAYLPDATIAADAPAWTLRAWQEEHKARVLAGERATAQELRAKLIAIRPN
jgi:gamma-glutamylcyclotransferase (GGCT)/AIG2-like uncharacterized protein YtfP